jgi:hypothetical protein
MVGINDVHPPHCQRAPFGVRDPTALRRVPAGISVIARVQDDRLVLDLRTVFAEQEPVLVRWVAAALR